MDDHISRQAAIDACFDGWNKDYKEIADDIKALPAADVAPVVRCKDCKHVCCRTYDNWQEPLYTCTKLRGRWNTDYDLDVNPNDFCSHGERKK